MPRYVLHFGHNVYLDQNGGMTRIITTARVFYNRREAEKMAKEIVQPPYCARQNPQPDPPEVVDTAGPNDKQHEFQLDIPPRPCRLPN